MTTYEGILNQPIITLFRLFNLKCKLLYKEAHDAEYVSITFVSSLASLPTVPGQRLMVNIPICVLTSNKFKTVACSIK